MASTHAHHVNPLRSHALRLPTVQLSRVRRLLERQGFRPPESAL